MKYSFLFLSRIWLKWRNRSRGWYFSRTKVSVLCVKAPIIRPVIWPCCRRICRTSTSYWNYSTIWILFSSFCAKKRNTYRFCMSIIMSWFLSVHTFVCCTQPVCMKQITFDFLCVLLLLLFESNYGYAWTQGVCGGGCTVTCECALVDWMCPCVNGHIVFVSFRLIYFLAMFSFELAHVHTLPLSMLRKCRKISLFALLCVRAFVCVARYTLQQFDYIQATCDVRVWFCAGRLPMMRIELHLCRLRRPLTCDFIEENDTNFGDKLFRK